MRISDIIKDGEYLYSDVKGDTEFELLTTSPSEVTESSVLIIPNSKKCKLDPTMPNPIAIICDTEIVLPEDLPIIKVANARENLARAFYRYYDCPADGIQLIGITGTNGKSSSAMFIEKILIDSCYKVGFIGTGRIAISGEEISDKKYSMTTPDPEYLYKIMRRMRNEGCHVIVMEVSSHALALHKVAPLKFDYALFTNLSAEHTDFHKDLEDYFSAKKKLFSCCKTAVINIDDHYGRRLCEMHDGRKITAGILWRGDIYAHNIQSVGLSGISYFYQTEGFIFKAVLNTPGVFNVYNSMLAAAVCIDMGVKPCRVKASLKAIERIPGRYEVINGSVSVIIDYAHTEYAFNNIMKELSKIKGNSSITVVFGCGGERDRAKRPKMGEAASKYADRIIITTDNSRGEDPKEIIVDIIRGIDSRGYEVEENRESAIRKAILDASDGDFVAIIGKGAEKYNIDQNGYHDFDEKRIILSALEDRRLKKCE